MAHWAKIENNEVVNVIVAEEDYIQKLDGEWIQTSYNNNIRANFAGIGFHYDRDNDVFYQKQPYPSWILNQTTWNWEAPIPHPNNGTPYKWNEETLNWVSI